MTLASQSAVLGSEGRQHLEDLFHAPEAQAPPSEVDCISLRSQAVLTHK